MAMMLAALAETDGHITGDAATLVHGLSAHDGQVKPGDLFAALPGVNTDGALFAERAIAKGAAALLTGPAFRPRPDMSSTPRVTAREPRLALARMAARFFPRQPGKMAAVTGTNGKTSVAHFAFQLWRALGQTSAFIGTTGVHGPQGWEKTAHTTPDAITLHRLLDRLADQGVTHAAIEASSHGLAQYRLDGVRLAIGALTNITRDHLDYHQSLAAYTTAKLRLFQTLLPPDATGVVDTDTPIGQQVSRLCRQRNLQLVTVGRNGDDLRLIQLDPMATGQRLVVKGTTARRHAISLPLIGAFQVSNALLAAGIVIASGANETATLEALGKLEGVRGRMELVGHGPQGAPIFVDYAHTPDALSQLLDGARPHVRGRLVVVMGCGGDRDRDKRPLMGAAAQAGADIVIVTDDNPRGEDPAAIRSEILDGCRADHGPVFEIAPREAAISRAVAILETGDMLIVAGKGHETGQEIAGRIQDFSDHDVIREICGGTDK